MHGDVDPVFKPFPAVDPITQDGGSAAFRIEMINPGGASLRDWVVYDVLPHVDDTGLTVTQLGTPRLTEFDVIFTGFNPHTLPEGSIIEYSASENPCRNELTNAALAAVIDKTLASAADADGDGMWDLSWTITVTNPGATATTYSLVDTPSFDTDINVAVVEVTAADVTTPTPINTWDAANGTLAIQTDMELPANTTHTYTVTATADVTAITAGTATLTPCDATTPAAGQGFFNQATLTTPLGTSTDQVCADPVIPDLTITKSVDGEPVFQADGSFTIAYDVVVTNTTAQPAQYTPRDTFGFPTGVAVTSVEVTSVPTLDVNTVFNGVSDTALTAAPVTVEATRRTPTPSP